MKFMMRDCFSDEDWRVVSPKCAREQRWCWNKKLMLFIIFEEIRASFSARRNLRENKSAREARNPPEAVLTHRILITNVSARCCILWEIYTVKIFWSISSSSKNFLFWLARLVNVKKTQEKVQRLLKLKLNFSENRRWNHQTIRCLVFFVSSRKKNDFFERPFSPVFRQRTAIDSAFYGK